MSATERPIATKRPLGIPENERRDMLDMLLSINKLAMSVFDAVEADAWDMTDLNNMLTLPDACNDFTLAMTRHADRIRRARG
mgnify:CR=1 FL=1